MLRFLSIFLMSLCLFQIHAESKITSSSTGVIFPKEVSFDNRELTLTGVATRKKFFIKIYSVASYLQNEAIAQGGDLLKEIMSDHWAKQLTLEWVYEADAKRVKDGYLESFQNALSDHQFHELQPAIEHYLSFFLANVQKGDTHILRWTPGGIIDVVINDQQVGTITNPSFAKTLWSLWFGEKSFVNRKSLLSLENSD